VEKGRRLGGDRLLMGLHQPWPIARRCATASKSLFIELLLIYCRQNRGTVVKNSCQLEVRPINGPFQAIIRKAYCILISFGKGI
jgi:hypothetical protein